MIDFLYHIDSPETKRDVSIPSDFGQQLELFEASEYLGLDELKLRVVNEGIMQRREFTRYTNVRRHYLDNINEEMLPYVRSLVCLIFCFCRSLRK